MENAEINIAQQLQDLALKLESNARAIAFLPTTLRATAEYCEKLKDQNVTLKAAMTRMVAASQMLFSELERLPLDEGTLTRITKAQQCIQEAFVDL